MTPEQAKAVIIDTMIAVGGNEVGMLDEGRNQLNPKVTGTGLFSLTHEEMKTHRQGAKTERGLHAPGNHLHDFPAV